MCSWTISGCRSCSAGVEAGLQKGFGVFGVAKAELHFGSILVGELQHEFAAAFAYRAGEFAGMAGEDSERESPHHIPALERTWACRAQEPQCCHRSIAGRDWKGAEMRRDRTEVGELVVILQKGNKEFRIEAKRRRTARMILPGVILSLVKISIFGRGDEFLRTAEMVTEVGLAASCERDNGAVMEVVVPYRIQTIAVLLDRADETAILRLVFGDNDGLAAAGGCADTAANLGKNVSAVRAVVMDCLGGVEPQTIEVVFGDPMGNVRQKEFADGMLFAPSKLMAFPHSVLCAEK